ncbi:MAG: DHH family phosphoesterase [Planctomycetia bacterium]|nr:DHH family phosphoesterase [Planctomycetia bacterium]
MTTTPFCWQRFKAVIDSASSILLISHVRPDADAIGSQIAFARALADYGKKVLLVNSDPVPPNLAFLDPEHWIRPLGTLTESERTALDQVDLLVSLDTSSWAQLGEMGQVIRDSQAAKIVLDHHAKGDDIGAERFVDADADATGTLVFKAIEALGLPLKYDYAWPLFAAISTDTGWFRFSSVTSDTYRTAAALIDAGVRPDDLYKIIYEQETFGRLKLIGFALANAKRVLNGKAILTCLTLENFEHAGALASESEDIVNMTLAVAGTEAAVIMVEQETGGFKLSFRSRCDLDCSVLAAEFGGGGHKKAAGAFLNLPKEEAETKILAALTEHYNRLAK